LLLRAFKLGGKRSSKGRNAGTVQKLQDYYAEAGALYVQAESAKSDEEFKRRQKSMEEWADEMGHWVINNMGNGAYVRLIQPSQPRAAMKNVKPDRVDLMESLSTIRDNLAKFVESPAWDKP
jgi:hypothetical protein